MTEHDVLVERLISENEEFRRLRDEHRGYEQELEALTQRPFLSTDHQWRMNEIKKRKLIVKDRMEAILREAKKGASSRAPA